MKESDFALVPKWKVVCYSESAGRRTQTNFFAVAPDFCKSCVIPLRYRSRRYRKDQGTPKPILKDRNSYDGEITRKSRAGQSCCGRR